MMRHGHSVVQMVYNAYIVCRGALVCDSVTVHLTASVVSLNRYVFQLVQPRVDTPVQAVSAPVSDAHGVLPD